MIRVLLLALSSVSIISLLLHFYGLSMRVTVPYVLLPSFLLSLGIRAKVNDSDKKLSEDLILGAWGGLLGTFAYDLFRWPFVQFLGYRLFATINAFGLFITEAPMSSPWTETVGWTYHFVNGVCFGVMYALVARGRHWSFAVLWGVVIELLAVLSPFGEAFALTSNSALLAVAFLGHVAFGIPLGLVVANPKQSLEWLSSVHRGLATFAVLAFLLWMTGPLVRESTIVSPELSQFETLTRFEERTYPDWLRLEHPNLRVLNNSEKAARFRVPKTGQTLDVRSHSEAILQISEPGIYQLYLETEGRSHSSFIWRVEP